MRKILGVAVLMLAFCCPAFAGVMPTPGSPTPPPSQPTSAVQEPTDAVQEPAADGIMPNGAPDTLTQLALELLAVLPTLL